MNKLITNLIIKVYQIYHTNRLITNIIINVYLTLHPSLIKFNLTSAFSKCSISFMTPIERPYSSRAFPPLLKPRSVTVNQHSRQSGDSPSLPPGDCTNKGTKEQTFIVTKLLTTLYTIGNGSKRENSYIQYIIAFGLVSPD